MVYSPAEAQTLPAAPDPVASMSAIHLGGQLLVRWDAPARAADTYDLEYKVGGAESWSSAAQDQTANWGIISGMDDAKGCVARVRAKNAGGASDWTTSEPAAP